MRTTLKLDDALMRQAKQHAAAEGQSLTWLIEQALRQYFAPAPAPVEQFRLRLVIRKGRLRPGVDLDDRDSFYERMEGRG